MRPVPVASVQKKVPACGMPSKLRLGGMYSPGCGPSTAGDTVCAAAPSSAPFRTSAGRAAAIRAGVQ
ncbi:hypothetical protein ACQ4WX_45285 [Streptomyces lasalocidi]